MPANASREWECSICRAMVVGFPNDAWPVNDGDCCDSCNWSVVLIARFRLQERSKNEPQPPK
jgi:hypothetical protein